jgi:hypothetical protein
MDDSLASMNKSELVQLLDEVHGIRAHRGVSKKLLTKSLLTGRDPEVGNPFDDDRVKIMRFLKKHWEKIQSQLELKCSGDCYKHSDMQVLACYLKSKQVLESEGD